MLHFSKWLPHSPSASLVASQSVHDRSHSSRDGHGPRPQFHIFQVICALLDQRGGFLSRAPQTENLINLTRVIIKTLRQLHTQMSYYSSIMARTPHLRTLPTRFCSRRKIEPYHPKIRHVLLRKTMDGSIPREETEFEINNSLHFNQNTQ